MEGRVLIISKGSSLMEFLHRNLPNSDYQVIGNQTEEELKTILDEVMPDFIILDIMMPRLDGIELCLSIRQWSQVPIIMLSTWEAGIDKVRGLDFNSENYLTEPFGGNELKELTEEVVRRSSNCKNRRSDYHIKLLLDTTKPVGWIEQTLLDDSSRMN